MLLKHHLEHFWKNQKKSILKKNFSTMHQQNLQKINFFAKNPQNKIADALNTPIPHSPFLFPIHRFFTHK